MASIIDEIFAREGEIDPDFQGINQCRAGSMTWDRSRGEPEAEFLARARMEAASAGYRLLSIAGHLPIGSAIKPHRTRRRHQ